jgi:molybdate transport system ATP-binding protein
MANLELENLTKRYPGVVSVDGVNLSVEHGEFVCLLGPSGCGKTTTLRMIAGFLEPDAGAIRVGGKLLSSVQSVVPPERRNMSMIFQSYAVWPHMTVRQNVGYGLKMQSMPPPERTSRTDVLLDATKLRAQADRYPSELSGGQQQRVALARALATSPRVMLLDEPLAALDAGTRLSVRADLRRHLAAFAGATVLVTHDPLDAMVLADRIVVIEHGAMVQAGTPAEIVRHPRTDYVARLAGLNLYRGTAGPDGVTLAGGGRLVVDEPLHGEVFVAFPPSAVAVYRGRPDGSPRNVWPVTVAGMEPYGDRVRVEFAGEPAVAAEVTTAAVAELDLSPGGAAWVAVNATETHAYPA